MHWCTLISDKTLGLAHVRENIYPRLTFEFFPKSVSDEQGERYHKDVSVTEKRYQGEWGPGVLTDYCLDLKYIYRKQSTHENHKYCISVVKCIICNPFIPNSLSIYVFSYILQMSPVF